MRSIAVVAIFGAILPGCFASSAAEPASGRDASTDAPQSVPASGRDASADAPQADSPQADAPTCPPTTSGPTEHGTDIKADETWTAAASPHIVTQSFQVLAGAKLTIEPCATVQLAAGATIDVNSTSAAALVAAGTSSQPIQFVAHDASPWNYLRVASPSTATLSWVTFSGGGGDTKFSRGATLVVEGNQTGVADPVVAVDHVTVTGSVGVGVLLESSGAFADSSTDLTVTRCGSSADPYPVHVGVEAAGTVPTGGYTGNAKDALFVDPGLAGKIKASITLHDRGVPYRMGVTQSSVFLVAADTGAPPAVLTIDPGVTLAMEKTAQIQIGVGQSATPTAPGSLVAAGTAAQPIVFTSAADVPAAGDWAGLVFEGSSSPANVLDDVSIKYAGGPSGAAGYSCLPPGDNDDAAILILGWVPPGPFLTNSAIVKSAANGVVRGWSASGPSFLGSNTFDVVQCSETLFRDMSGGCPASISCE